MQLCAKGGLSVQRRYFRYRCVPIGIERIPLLASSRGGVAERLIKCREASADREAGVVFRLRTQRKTTPAASASVASQHFLEDAVSPPCTDARRGITRQRNSSTASVRPLSKPRQLSAYAKYPAYVRLMALAKTRHRHVTGLMSLER